MDSREIKPETGNYSFLQPNLIAIELRKRNEDLQTFRDLINIKCRLEDQSDPEIEAKWKPVIIELLRLITTTEEVGNERVLLGSLAFVNVLFANCQLDEFTNHLTTYWKLEKPFLSAFGEEFKIRDLEWFKIVMIHGYLQLNIEEIYSREVILHPFKILHKNCLSYSKYSYFAYKILQMWLERTEKSDFWLKNDMNLERDLESVIFSNWDNCLCENARKNATQIFPSYLRIMSEKYKDFLKFIFESCVKNLSWQNETKYTILTEICKIWENLPEIVKSGLPSHIFTSLTKNHLKHGGTKLYLTILNKLKTNDWEKIFAHHFLEISADWERKKQTTALHLLWEQWMKPTFIKFPNTFLYLENRVCFKYCPINRSYWEKIGTQQGFKLNSNTNKLLEVLSNRITDICEFVRFNAFVTICQIDDWNMPHEIDPFIIVKRFLYFNVNTSSTFMRKGIIKNFKIFIANVVKFADNDSNANCNVRQFFEWLHEFLLDCFEIGSCYQRRILGLNLFAIILNFTCDDRVAGVSGRDKRYEATLRRARNLRLLMEAENVWKFQNKMSAVMLLKLVLDQMDDVRDKSTSILLDYFDPKILTPADKDILMQIAMEHCESSKFYEIASGAALINILATWLPLGESMYRDEIPIKHAFGSGYINLFLQKARYQLEEMRKDILKSAVQGSSFFGAMTVILEIGFRDGPEKVNCDDVTGEILDLAEEATNFFLAALSANAKDSEYASSFEEMGMAIEDSIRNSEVNENTEECILSPAHQLVVSCIWMSLKICSEVAVKIGLLAETEEIARRSTDLIISVLLKCRHKGAIEAAGSALARLTKTLCKGKYNNLIESHLMDLLSIDVKNNINLTRRGAGFSIMFHRIVSSDDRRNRPLLHLAVRRLLNSLKTQTDEVQSQDILRDSPRVRHLHFLRSLIADKELQAQLLPYIEDICLMCFGYLQSPEWTVRNASLQLFGAIVPRLVGQCSAKELDYGVGYSVDHFVTHYPILADNVLSRLELLAKSIETKKCILGTELHIDCNAVPILTLLSKMSTGGCELVDYSSMNFVENARSAFKKLFAHPVFHVRALAGKAYAAFVPLPNIPRELMKMIMETIGAKCNNYNHGQVCAQIYLRRKFSHETQCTGREFVNSRHQIYQCALRRAVILQLGRLDVILERWKKQRESGQQFCYVVESARISSLIKDSYDICYSETWLVDFTHHFINSLSTDRTEPGFFEFLDNLMNFYVKFQTKVLNPTTVRIILASECLDHKIGFLDNLTNGECDREIFEILVNEALTILRNSSKSYIFITLIRCIRNIYFGFESTTHADIAKSAENPGESLFLKIRNLAHRLEVIDENSMRPFATELRNIGHLIAIKLTQTDDRVLDGKIRYIAEKMFDDDETVKASMMECLSCLVEEHTKNDYEFIFSSVERANIFVEIMMTTLMDKDPEIQESIAKILNPVVMKFTQPSNERTNAKVSCHKILNTLALIRKTDSSSSISDRLETFKLLINTVNISEITEGLKSPFYEDETFHRDDTSLLNILFYCIKTLIKPSSRMRDSDFVELQQIDGIIRAKYEFQRDGLDLRNLNARDVEFLIKLSTSDYLSNKKCVLMKIIDEFQSIYRIGDESSS